MPTRVARLPLFVCFDANNSFINSKIAMAIDCKNQLNRVQFIILIQSGLPDRQLLARTTVKLLCQIGNQKWSNIFKKWHVVSSGITTVMRFHIISMKKKQSNFMFIFVSRVWKLGIFHTCSKVSSHDCIQRAGAYHYNFLQSLFQFLFVIIKLLVTVKVHIVIESGHPEAIMR